MSIDWAIALVAALAWFTLMLVVIIGIHVGRLTDRIENLEHRLMLVPPCPTCAAEDDE